MINFSLMVFLIFGLARGQSSYFDQQCNPGLDDKLIHKTGTVFYYQVEAQGKLEELLVMNFQMDVFRDDKVINQIKLFNNFENQPFRRGEIILLPRKVVLSELNKRLMVLENCEVVPFGIYAGDPLL